MWSCYVCLFDLEVHPLCESISFVSRVILSYYYVLDWVKIIIDLRDSVLPGAGSKWHQPDLRGRPADHRYPLLCWNGWDFPTEDRDSSHLCPGIVPVLQNLNKAISGPGNSHAHIFSEEDPGLHPRWWEGALCKKADPSSSGCSRLPCSIFTSYCCLSQAGQTWNWSCILSGG